MQIEGTGHNLHARCPGFLTSPFFNADYNRVRRSAIVWIIIIKADHRCRYAGVVPVALSAEVAPRFCAASKASSESASEFEDRWKGMGYPEKIIVVFASIVSGAAFNDKSIVCCYASKA